MKLSIDVREGVSGHVMDVDCHSAEFALDWLRRLDGARHTLLCLERSDGWRLMIGGGPLHFIVTLDDDDRSLTFFDPTANDSANFTLCAGGQFADFWARNCTDQDGAARMIASFFAKRETEFVWHSA